MWCANGVGGEVGGGGDKLCRGLIFTSARRLRGEETLPHVRQVDFKTSMKTPWRYANTTLNILHNHVTSFALLSLFSSCTSLLSPPVF